MGDLTDKTNNHKNNRPDPDSDLEYIVFEGNANKLNKGDSESIEFLYNEMLRLIDEIFKLADFKLNNANNILIF